MIKVKFATESDLDKAAVIHGAYLEETGAEEKPELSMLLMDGELAEMEKRFEAQGVNFSHNYPLSSSFCKQ